MSLTTPAGEFRIYVNGAEIDFAATERKDLGLWTDGETLVLPDALFRVVLDADRFKEGDVIVGRIVGAPMKADGGDEHTMDMIGQRGGYTFGLGTVDDAEFPMPVHLNRILDDGFELVVLSPPPGWRPWPELIHFDVAWRGGETDLSWDVISYVVC